jgi:hypothetical protein
MNYIAKLNMNSLYGRYGMDDNFNYINILDKNSSNKYIDKFIENIIDIIDLDHSNLIMTNNNIKNINTKLDNRS